MLTILLGHLPTPVYYNEHIQSTSNSLRTAPGLPSVVQSCGAITALRRLEHVGTTFFTSGIRHELCRIFP